MTNERENGMKRRRIIVGALLAGALLTGCEEQFKSPRGLGDAPVGAKNGDRKDVIEMPNGFPNLASACDGHGHRVYVTSHGDKNTSAPAIVDDPTCGR